MLRFLCVLVLSSAALSQLLPGQDVNVNSFDAVDANKDGTIDGQEFNIWAAKNLQNIKGQERKRLFSTYDTDHDGLLIVAEFVPLAFAISQKQTLTTQTVFERLDKNDDGLIDTVERSQSGVDAAVIAGLLTVADVNGDGLLSKHEFEMAVDTGRQKTTEEKNRDAALQLFADLDSNRDAKLTKSELKAFASRYSTATESDISSAFAALDANHDKVISISELSRFPSKISSFFNFQAPPPVMPVA